MSKKVEVQLYGRNGHSTVAVPHPRGISRPTPPPDNADSRHRKAVFAALSDMQPLFDTAGISETDYWDCIKSEFGVASRAGLSAPMWARISATLNACRRDPKLFNKMVAKVKAHIERQKPIDASPVIFADPEDTIDTCFVMRRHRTDSTDKLVYVGDLSKDIRERCQAHADKTRSIVFLYHAGQKREPFYPSNGRSPL